MDLKELVLSTLEELDDRIAKEEEIRREIQKLHEEETPTAAENSKDIRVTRSDDEIAFLRHTKERLEVLFQGLKSSEIKEPEAKLEITLKYLQLLLAQVNERLDEIKS